jgi:hypothetical protein
LLVAIVLDGRHSVSGWVVAPSVLVPSNGVFGRFDLVALCGCHTLNVCLVGLEGLIVCVWSSDLAALCMVTYTVKLYCLGTHSECLLLIGVLGNVKVSKWSGGHRVPPPVAVRLSVCLPPV